jgi:hypothetical protein
MTAIAWIASDAASDILNIVAMPDLSAPPPPARSSVSERAGNAMVNQVNRYQYTAIIGLGKAKS